MRNGYTLLELLLVITIITIIGVVSSSYTGRFYSQNALTNTTDQLVSTLRKAQFYSMMSKQGGGVWGVRYTTSPGKRLTLFLEGNSGFDEHYEVHDSVSISGLTTITFTHIAGLPSTEPTITITGNSQSDTLTINSMGVVSRN